MYAVICPDCGAHLDPGERCDCRDDAEPPQEDTFGERKPHNSGINIAS